MIIERALTRETTQDSDQDSLEVVNEFVTNLHPWQQVNDLDKVMTKK